MELSSREPTENVFPFIKILKRREMEKNYEKTLIPPFFLEFLKQRHSKCLLERGIKVCERNAYGITTKAKCLKCEERFSTALEAHVNQVRINKDNELMQKAETSESSTSQSAKEKKQALNPGDHIAWHSLHGIWHHAIVIENLQYDSHSEHCFTGICNKSSGSIQSNDHCQRIARVKVIENTFDERKFKINETVCDIFECMDVCRFEYCASYPPEYTVELAKATLQQFRENEMKRSYHELVYDPLEGNCEHFARQCKTGSSESGQVKDSQQECSRGTLMSLLRLVSLFIWFIVEVIVDEETSPFDGNDAGLVHAKSLVDERVKEQLNSIELHVSAVLSGLFFIIYIVYATSREISDRYPRYILESEPTELGSKCCNKGCCYQEKHAILRCIICLAICRPVKKCFTGCPSPCNRCCRRACSKNCNNCYLFCTSYWNVVMRVFIREVIAIGLPIIAFVFVERTANRQIFIKPGNFLTALCAFLISLFVSLISVPLGRRVAGLCETLFSGCCLRW